ncbi:hypothetical protein FN846DRAFT_667869 [Sphaerosporella brunnea]|uniref:Uncharacterized protein n=1 Tax=Sphaerosporella brunnea TaxID=1250544 RepID=A0A5J5FAB7_9PEZI|nr:hypothetical protein FN846DRAFT_667869 [Sphaerosporella brunnea]
MEALPEITPVQQQLSRERFHDREELAEQITTLKSLLRLDADGIGDCEDLIDVLERTRTYLDRFSITVQRESMSLESPSAIPPAGAFRFETSDNLDATDSPSSPDRINRVRSLSGSSTRSSWRSTPSTASTAATSVSPPDSFFSQRFSSPPMFEYPYTSRFRRFRDPEIVEGDDEEDGQEAEDMDMEDEEGPDASDASFQRLSTILASLQRQAEASLCSPPTIEEEASEDAASFWGDADVRGDLSPISTKGMNHRHSQPGTPRLSATLPSRKVSAFSFSLPQSPVKRASWAGDQLFSSASQSAPVRRRSALVPGHERQSSRDSIAEGKSTEMDLERTVMEFLEFFGRGSSGEADIMFRWVWIYMMGGGFVWLVVGWVLGWGCNACGESLVCERR